MKSPSYARQNRIVKENFTERSQAGKSLIRNLETASAASGCDLVRAKSSNDWQLGDQIPYLLVKTSPSSEWHVSLPCWNCRYGWNNYSTHRSNCTWVHWQLLLYASLDNKSQATRPFGINVMFVYRFVHLFVFRWINNPWEKTTWRPTYSSLSSLSPDHSLC